MRDAASRVLRARTEGVGALGAWHTRKKTLRRSHGRRLGCRTNSNCWARHRRHGQGHGCGHRCPLQTTDEGNYCCKPEEPEPSGSRDAMRQASLARLRKKSICSFALPLLPIAPPRPQNNGFVHSRWSVCWAQEERRSRRDRLCVCVGGGGGTWWDTASGGREAERSQKSEGGQGILRAWPARLHCLPLPCTHAAGPGAPQQVRNRRIEANQ